MDCESPLPDGYGTETEKVYAGLELAKSLPTCNGYIFLPSTSGLNNNLKRFITNVLPLMETPFVLITADGDAPFPSSLTRQHLKRLLQHPLLIRWYTQNYDGSVTHPKLFAIPIGFDFHTRRDDDSYTTNDAYFARVYQDREKALTTKRISLPLLPAWNADARHVDRRTLPRLLKDCKVPHATAAWGNYPSMVQNYTRHVAGFSPHGHGLDCHRTYEMLWYGMIPIVKTSSLDVLYHRLPVVIIEDWKDLCSIPLKIYVEEVEDMWPPSDEVFTMQYWLAP